MNYSIYSIVLFYLLMFSHSCPGSASRYADNGGQAQTIFLSP